MSNKKIAIFGGSFNPVHNGHMSLCRKCISDFGFDKVLMIPTNIPPHKSAAGLASNEDRFNMLKIATKNDASIEVSDIEYRLGDKSYTINTIEEVEKEYKAYDLYLIVGSDMFKIFDQWREYKKILSKVTLLVGARSDNDEKELNSIKDRFTEFYDKINIVKLDIIDLSSTQIRNAVFEHKDVSAYLPDGVYEYISEKGLYR